MSEKDECRRQLVLLRHLWKDIVQDLDVYHVIPYLLQHLALVHDDKERVEAEVTLEDKAEKLLSILENKAVVNSDGQGIKVFIDSLKQDYAWLHNRFTEDVPDFKSSPRAEPDKEDRVFDSPKHARVKTMLEAGGVQCLPAVTVHRHEPIETIQNELRELKRHQYLVIQGMAGAGKSVLATQALNSARLVTNIFPDGVFVLSIGKECSESKDGILAKMRILCERLEEVRAPISLEHGMELLKAAFLKRPQALLVLDGVWRAEVIRAFDVGCATMATTRDLSVMDVVSGRVREIRISDGFTEAESLELFRSTLNFPSVRHLPEAAKAIHANCQGSPMVVSLISSLLLDHQDEAGDEGRWKYYLDSLSRRKYSKMRRARDYEHESVFDAIALSIESLSEPKRKYYSDFALFQYDVGIPSPVLEVLWGLERYAVGDIMKHFVRKSLASEEYNSVDKWSVYSINSLQLDYVKYQLHSAGHLAEKELHARLVNHYLETCASSFYQLPDDHYIYFYIGYHLYKSGNHQLFPQVYLNLLFIGQKIRITGPADLLVDIRKYHEFIVADNDENAKLVEEIQAFTQLVGHRLYAQNDADIVQAALQYPNFALLNRNAHELATQQTNRLYLQWRNADAKQWKNAESTTLCSDGVRCVKFVGSTGNHFVAGLNNGDIVLCDVACCGVCYIFSGHIQSVQSLNVFKNSDGTRHVLLSASEDRSCKLWNLKILLDKVETETHESHSPRSTDDSPSPKLRTDKWTLDKPSDESLFTFEFHTAPVSYAEFSDSGDFAVSSSVNEILVWNTSNGQVLFKNSPDVTVANSSFLSCHFGSNYEQSPIPYLLAGMGNQVMLLSLAHSSLTAAVEGHHMNIVQVLVVTSTSFYTVAENEIALWQIKSGDSVSNSRRKSLSPRKSYPMSTMLNGTGSFKGRTQADSIPFGHTASASGNLLKPPQQDSTWGSFENNNNEDVVSRKFSTSDCYSPALVTTQLDNGTHFLKIWRQEIIHKKSTGLFQCAAIALDRELIACGTSERKIFLWNLDKKYCIGEFSSHSGWLRCVDFSNVDEWTLLSGSEDHTVMVWDLKEESEGRKRPQKSPAFASVYLESVPSEGCFLSAFSTDSNTVQVYCDTVLVYETAEMREKITIVTISNDGRFLAFGTAEGRIFQKNLQIQHPLNGNQLRKAGTRVSLVNTSLERVDAEDLNEVVQFLCFDPTVVFLVAISADWSVSVFKQFKPLYRLVLNGCGVAGVHFPFNKFFTTVSGQDATVVNMIELESGKPFKDLILEGVGAVTCSALKTDSSCLAVGTAQKGVFMCTLRLNVGVSKSSSITCKHMSEIQSLAFSSDGEKLAVGHANGLVTIWNISLETYTEERNLVLHKSRVRSILFSPLDNGHSRWLVSCGDKLAFWSLERAAESLPKTSFMAERRRKKSGDSRPPSRLSLDISSGVKMGRQGKRELLQTVSFRGAYAQHVVADSAFSKFVAVDDAGIFYFLQTIATPLL